MTTLHESLRMFLCEYRQNNVYMIKQSKGNVTCYRNSKLMRALKNRNM